MKRRARQRVPAQRDAWTPQTAGARYLRVKVEDIYGGFALSRRRSDVTQLAASIAKHGLLSPLVVRRNAQAGRYALVCGARRLEACRLLGMKEVDALLVEGDEMDAFACFFEEHWTRAPVPCADEATAISMSADELCSRFALPKEMILRRRRLLSLGERTVAFAREQGMTLEQTEPLLMIPREDRRLEAAAIIAQRGLCGAQARRLIAGIPGHGPQSREEGKRRAMRSALKELSAIVERLNVQGIDACFTMHSQDGGVIIQMIFKNTKSLDGGQEKKEKEEK